MIRFRRAAGDELERLHQIIAECGRDMSTRLGLRHWDPPLPIADFREHARTREVWTVLDADALIGTFTVGLQSLPDYPAHYFEPVGTALYLNRLAIRPSLQGRGLGRACMAEVESIARARGARAVRFDAVAAHDALRAFYRALGYRECGPFQIGSIPVECFEKLV